MSILKKTTLFVVFLLLCGSAISTLVKSKINTQPEIESSNTDLVELNLTGGWQFCARENKICRFSGKRIVRYGAKNKYHFGVYSNAVRCNNRTFGDPKRRTKKACVYWNGNNGYTPCVTENQTCVFPAGKKVSVRYGANGRFREKTAQGSITCSNSVFSDPNRGVRKYCEYKVIGDAVVAIKDEKWVKCADENTVCRVNGRQIVRYGQYRRFHYMIVDKAVNCNNQTFTDPMRGHKKICQVYQFQDKDWIRCVNENQVCKLPPGKRITARYGITSYVKTKQFSGATSFNCNNSTFGDPAKGIKKFCEYKIEGDIEDHKDSEIILHAVVKKIGI